MTNNKYLTKIASRLETSHGIERLPGTRQDISFNERSSKVFLDPPILERVTRKTPAKYLLDAHGKKIALGVGGAAALGGLAYGAKKYLEDSKD